MVSAERTDYTRFPIVFIQDNAGNLLYESNDNVNCQILYEYHDDISEKDYPRSIHYIFEKDGKKVDYTLESKRIIETNGKNNLPFAQKLVAKTLGVNASYTRYDAIGTLVFNNQKRTGKLIYEFMYPGNTYKGHM